MTSKLALFYNCRWCNKKYSRVEKYIDHAKKQHGQEVTVENVALPTAVHKDPAPHASSVYGDLLVRKRRDDESLSIIDAIKKLASDRLLEIEAGEFKEIDASKFPDNLKCVDPKFVKRAIEVQVEKLIASNKPKDMLKDVPKETHKTYIRECNICCSDEIDGAIYPCGHAFACYECSSKLHECAACRSKIEKVVKLFLV